MKIFIGILIGLLGSCAEDIYMKMCTYLSISEAFNKTVQFSVPELWMDSIVSDETEYKRLIYELTKSERKTMDFPRKTYVSVCFQGTNLALNETTTT